jgi:hypothetical protein
MSTQIVSVGTGHTTRGSNNAVCAGYTMGSANYAVGAGYAIRTSYTTRGSNNAVSAGYTMGSANYAVGAGYAIRTSYTTRGSNNAVSAGYTMGSANYAVCAGYTTRGSNNAVCAGYTMGSANYAVGAGYTMGSANYAVGAGYTMGSANYAVGAGYTMGSALRRRCRLHHGQFASFDPLRRCCTLHAMSTIPKRLRELSRFLFADERVALRTSQGSVLSTISAHPSARLLIIVKPSWPLVEALTLTPRARVIQVSSLPRCISNVNGSLIYVFTN